MLRTTDGQHLVIRKPLALCYISTSVVVSTLQTVLSRARLNVEHVGSGMGRTLRGRSSSCEQRDKSATLTFENCISPCGFGQAMEHVILVKHVKAKPVHAPGSTNRHIYSFIAAPRPPAPEPLVAGPQFDWGVLDNGLEKIRDKGKIRRKPIQLSLSCLLQGQVLAVALSLKDQLAQGGVHSLFASDVKQQLQDMLQDIGFFKHSGPKDPYYNAYSTNTHLLKAVLCAGLMPNIARAEAPSPQSSQVCLVHRVFVSGCRASRQEL